MVEDNSVILSKHGLTVEALVRVNGSDVRSEAFYIDNLGLPGTILENKKFDEEDTDHIIKNIQVIRVINVNNSDD